MRLFVTPVTAMNLGPPYRDYQGSESEKLQRQSGKAPADNQEFVMTTRITTSISVFLIIVGVWVADVVCYHPTVGGFDPTTPVSLTIAQ